jgi:hypothetical protein
MNHLDTQSAGLGSLYENIDRQFDLLLQRMLSLVPSQEKLDALKEARLRLERLMEAWNT